MKKYNCQFCAREIWAYKLPSHWCYKQNNRLVPMDEAEEQIPVRSFGGDNEE